MKNDPIIKFLIKHIENILTIASAVSLMWFKFLGALLLISGVFVLYIKTGKNLYISNLLLISFITFLIYIYSASWSYIYNLLKLKNISIYFKSFIYIFITSIITMLLFYFYHPLVDVLAALATGQLVK